MSAIVMLLGLQVAPIQPPSPSVAVLDEPAFAPEWVATSPSRLVEVFRSAGLDAEPVHVAALADAAILTPERYDVVVLPAGPHFPLEAIDAFRAYLRAGGNFIALGGYAFREPVERTEGGWRLHNARVEAERAPERLRERSLLPAFAEMAWNHGDAVRLSVAGEGTDRTLVVDAVGVGGGASLVATVEPGRTYALRTVARSEGVTSPGFGFAAVYQLDADNQIVQWFDSDQLRGTTDWRTVTRTFTAHPDAVRTEVRVGAYMGSGRVEFRELVLAPWEERAVLTTAGGEPRDGLVCKPEQMGLFDADFPLRRAAAIAAAESPWIAETEAPLPEGTTGWAAAGVTGGDWARWMPLLNAKDRYGRDVGPAMAMLCHYQSHYAGSMWAYCGLEGDLLDILGPEKAAEALAGCVRFMRRGVFLPGPRCLPDVVAPGEAPLLRVEVRNLSLAPRTVIVRAGDGLPERALTVEPRGAATAEFALPAKTEGGLHTLPVTLADETGEVFDQMEASFVVVPPDAYAGAPQVEFRGNAFTVNGRPRILFGSDTYANVFASRVEGPATWSRDLGLCRDYGLDVYENLQFAWRAGGWVEEDRRKVDGILRLAAERERLYMAGWLIGADTWVSDDDLADQSRFLSEMAARYRDAPHLIHYLNGDLRGEVTEGDGAAERFREWLFERYGSVPALREAWGDGMEWEFDAIPYPVGSGDGWNSRRAIDARLFGVHETRRWLAAHAKAVRSTSGGQPVTAEYYQMALDGVDLPQTIEPLDVANIGFFGHRPGMDLEDLARAIAFADSRARGRGVNLGEFGVKTHPAWAPDRAAPSYHTTRGEEAQRELFVGLVHIGLGMGVTKFQNWCLRDADETVFPWGLFHPNAQTPKPVAHVYRALTLLGHHVTPKYEAPAVTLLLPDCHRLGPGGDRAYQAALAACDALTLEGVPFSVLPDTEADAIPWSTRVLWWPAPFCCSEETRSAVEAFVRGGGGLYLSGDLSFDEGRERTQLRRFESLIGCSVIEAGGDPPALIAANPDTVHRLELETAETLLTAADGQPLVVRNALGLGAVVFHNAPAELTRSAPELRGAYLAALEGLAAPRIEAVGEGVLAFESPIHEGGRMLVLMNMNHERASVAFRLGALKGTAKLEPRSPALVAADEDGRWRALSAVGTVRLANGVSLEAAAGAAALRLEGDEYAVLVAPYAAGEIALQDPAMPALAWELGEPSGGAWRVYEEAAAVGAGAARLELDPDRATLLSLLGDPGALQRAWGRLWGVPDARPRTPEE